MKNLEYGKRYKWAEIQDQYPDQWVFMKDITMKSGAIDSFVFLYVCPHKDKVKYMNLLRNEGIVYKCKRTTFAMPNVGVLC